LSPHSSESVQQWITAGTGEGARASPESLNLRVTNRKISIIPKFTLQSETLKEPEGDEQKQENVTFVDENPGDVVEAPSPYSTGNIGQYKAGAELADFLSRPVLIQTYTWTEGGVSLDQTFNPWHDYFDNAAIKYKLNNFTYLRANLKLKVLINASPFYYGFAGMFYQPISTWDPCPVTETATYDGWFVPLSQRPHIWLYPQCNQGGELTLPFFYYKDWLDITSSSDLTNMGSIILHQIIALTNANSVSSGDVTIQIYAWAEDVEVCGPTIKLAVQSEKLKEAPINKTKTVIKSSQSQKQTSGEEDEYDDKPVSHVASTIAAASGLLANFPGIGPYARATSIAASAVAGVASIFGYSDPPEIDNVKAFKNLPFHSLAATAISQPVDKLTIDAKNELTIDPRIANMSGDDELLITSLCGRESLVYWTSWDATDAAETSLVQSTVHPMQGRIDGTGPYIYQFTPMCMVGKLFKYWRGDIVYRFRFICTKYHRGRVRVTWDPNGDIFSSSDSNTTNFNRIIDISEETDVSIRIPYMQDTSFKQTSTFNAESTGASVASRQAAYDNGSLSMRVLTQQSSPVANAPVYVIVSMYAAENIEFAAPVDVNDVYSFYTLQSEKLPSPCYADGAEAVPIFPKPPEILPDLNGIYMGEKIMSLRTLMRRANLSRLFYGSPNTTDRYRVTRTRFSRLPLYYGYDPNGIHEAEGTITPASDFSFNYVQTTHINWIGSCFIGTRGSVQWHINSAGPSNISHLEVYRDAGGLTVGGYRTGFSVSSSDTHDEAMYDLCVNNSAQGAGVSVLNQNTQTGLSIEAPFYSRFKFDSCAAATRTLGESDVETTGDSLELRVYTAPSADTSLQDPLHNLVHFYVSAGTDFTFLYFLNVPSMFFLNPMPPGKDT